MFYKSELNPVGHVGKKITTFALYFCLKDIHERGFFILYLFETFHN